MRKKSSKLMDFESPDDLTDKHKRQRAQQQQLQAQLMERFDTPPPILPGSPPLIQGQSGHGPGSGGRNRKNSGSLAPVKIKLEGPPSISDTEEQSSEFESDDPGGMHEEEERYSMDSVTDEEVDPLMIDEKETGFRRLEPPEQETPSQANSLYMLEKCKKKLIIKDGKVIGRIKAQRKDKGVSYEQKFYTKIYACKLNSSAFFTKNYVDQFSLTCKGNS